MADPDAPHAEIEIDVRQAVLADRERIARFLAEAYGERARFKFPARWEWQFASNPFWHHSGLPIWIALEKETQRVVGQSCAMVEPLTIGGRLYELGWGVDFYVLPEYRQCGIGSRLQGANKEANEVFMSVAMSNTTRRIKDRLGMIPLAPVALYHKILRRRRPSWKVVLRPATAWIRTPSAASLARRAEAPAPPTPAVRRELLKGTPWYTTGIDLEPVDVFSAEVDDLVDEVCSQFVAIVPRDSQFLNWKYVTQPLVQYERFVARKGGAVRGYVVVRRAQAPEPDHGIIADVCVHPEDTAVVDALFAFALRRLSEQRVAYVTAASTVSSYQRALEAIGFVEVAQQTPMFHCAGELPQLAELQMPGGLFIGKSDHDWDQYPLAV
ncbi:MAG: hypothetical protein JXA93_01620 [Anaerolineae bacterium]|nr:hypothetical protein [Anaerolineae bacterium]